MDMQWYRWLALFSLALCVAACLWHFIRLIRLGRPTDYSKQSGQVPPAVRFAFTGAMSPARKESALLHLPTYFAGIVYHMGTFLSLLLFFLIFAGYTPGNILDFTSENILAFSPENLLALLGVGMLTASVLCGIAIFLRRATWKKIRSLSNPDDYISNLLVTLFQLLTALVILFPSWQMIYFIEFSLLMLYLPLGKLKHTVYFFAARYLLGLFYGWRGVWPPPDKLKT
jgi:hypothetical protein